MQQVKKPARNQMDVFEHYQQQADQARIALIEQQLRQLKPSSSLLCIAVVVITALVIYISTMYPIFNNSLAIVLLSLLSILAACFAFSQVTRIDKRIDALYKLIKATQNTP